MAMVDNIMDHIWSSHSCKLLTFAVTLLFTDTTYSIHYMECEIGNLNMTTDEVHQYLLQQQRSEERRVGKEC